MTLLTAYDVGRTLPARIEFTDGTTRECRGLRRLVETAAAFAAQSDFSYDLLENELLRVLPEVERSKLEAWTEVVTGGSCTATRNELIFLLVVHVSNQRRVSPNDLIRAIREKGSARGYLFPRRLS